MVRCVKIFSDKGDIVEQAFWALRNMSFDDYGQQSLLKANALHEIYTAAKLHYSSPRVCEQACGAIGNLVYNPTKSSIPRKECEGVEVLCNIMEMNIGLPTIIEKCASILYNLAANNSNCEKMKTTAIQKKIENVLSSDKLSPDSKVLVQAVVDRVKYSIPLLC